MDCRRIIIASLLLLSGACAAYAKGPLMKYGIEWGISSNIYYDIQLNYVTEDGYRIDDSSYGLSFITNGHIMGNVGMNIKNQMDISLLSGYMGVSRNNRMIPVLLRLGYHFNSIENDGLFCFLDGGAAFHISREGEPVRKPAAMTDAGMGYRFILTRRANLELMFNVKGTFDSLLVTDPNTGEFIHETNIRNNKAFFLTLNLGIGINF